MREQVAANTPWDQFVREILVATGESLENGATNFYALSQSPEDMTENACQAFLGLSIGCAKCHNHPLEKWTNDQYYAMANLFARVRAKGWGGEAAQGDGRRTLYVAQSGDLIQPRTGKPQPPTPLDGRPLPLDDPADRRTSLADWLTSPENPYFARAITNRVWANFFGVGLVEKVDDMRASNPASNEALLKAAADAPRPLEVRPQGADEGDPPVQRLSAVEPSARREPRRAPVLFALLPAADDGRGAARRDRAGDARCRRSSSGIAVPGGERQKTDFYPPGTRAIQLYDSAVENYFLQAFGRNPRRIVCECDRSEEPTIVQVLHISNGNTLNEKLKAPGQPGREAARACGARACPTPRWSTRSTWPAWRAIRPTRNAIACSRCCPRRARRTSERSSRMCSGAC